jgi:glutamate synthase (NADPH/NADH) large chain
MTGGVAVILGPLGLNFGSGMTGGLAYVLRAEAEDVLHRDFVTIAETDTDEQAWLRRSLKEHVHFTASPRAARLLSRRGALPLVRVQPIHFQGTVEATWSPILSQFKHRLDILTAPIAAPISQTALHA